MRSYRILVIFAFVGAFTQCAFQTTGQRNDAATPSLNHVETIHGSAVTTGHDHQVHFAAVSHLAVPQAHHDLVAIADMHSYALHNLGRVNEYPDSFGMADRWAHDWELRWIDYEAGGHTIRIYHATNKHDTALRYTSLWDGHTVRYHDWERVH